MVLAGALVNAALVAAGAVAGCFLKRGIPDRISKYLSEGTALVVLYVGISGAVTGKNVIAIILAFVFSVMIMTALTENPVSRKAGQLLTGHLASAVGKSGGMGGFINASLFVCAGAMGIIGSLESGIRGNNDILYSKSVIDFVAVMIIASTSGSGAILAAVPTFIYEGLLTLAAGVIGPYLTDTVVTEMSASGSIVIIGMALNMLGMTDLRLSRYILAPFVVIPFCYLFS